MIKNRDIVLIKILLIMSFSIIGGLYLIDYLDFSSYTNQENVHINYIFKEKRIVTAGRADDNYQMIFLYNNEVHELDLTREEYDLINDGEYPQLFQSKKSGKIYSASNIRIALRIVIGTSILIIITLIFPSDIDKKIFKLFKIKKKSIRS